SVFLLGAGYLGILRAVERDAPAWPLGRLVRRATLIGLPLLALLPPTSADYLAYFYTGRVLSVYHVSPWHHPLSAFPAESAYLSAWIWGPTLKCPYGPVWVAVTALTTGISSALLPGGMTPAAFMVNLLLLRAANAAAFIGAALAVWRIQGLLWPRQQR